MSQPHSRAVVTVVTAADNTSRRFGHRWVGCEHLLLALSEAPEPTAEVLRRAGVTSRRLEAQFWAADYTAAAAGWDATSLAILGVDLNELRDRAEAVHGRGSLDRSRRTTRRQWGLRPAQVPRSLRRPERILLTRRAHAAFRRARVLARNAGRDAVGTSDLALAIIDDTRVRVQLLRHLEIDSKALAACLRTD